ncbi:nitrite/sulfite reductase [Siculibacillus lacustris]|uniref:Nitrite/sulfite reductase n=1 Tax=Siculibacillus lacustris TaxID=1549641 RepID=A0A4Q9VLS8_9HYPH|nr:nitrite/sulfite reductase [Siculibacillus lacustris]TBW35965.1 nitrite/sulfite reductase [Siculibacillus lacustris]
MYVYDAFDHRFVAARVAQFRDQVNRRLSGELTEEQFRPLRLMNGVYLQLHAYMLRVAIPYGTLSSRQMRRLAHIARVWDKGYGHFTTRQNIQFNWPKLEAIPDILEALADVEMHAIQTSGNCIRNVTADHFAGADPDEVADPRPYAEILRQWSSLHPEFTYLPRKFKIAVTGAAADRAAIRFHDIGLVVVRNAAGEIGFEVHVGGGMGRTPFVAWKLKDFLPQADLLSYVEAILRVYNLYGRRDNKYKARIKILLHEAGLDKIRAEVEAEWAEIRDGALKLAPADVAAIAAQFAPPVFAERVPESAIEAAASAADAGFARWVASNVRPHRVAGHASVTISLKPIGGVPGDATAEQMEAVATLADAHGFGEIRVSHRQNLILPHVARDDLPALYAGLVAAGLATANAGLITDTITCPGLDFCALANARSIPIAQEISTRLGDAARQAEIGPLEIKISGCINACGHHHVGHIGILGVDRKGREFYQITLGGSADEQAAIGDSAGPGFWPEEVPGAVETLVATYLALRSDPAETFLATYRRVGLAPFREALDHGAR